MEPREGAFYVWTRDEIEDIFADDADVVCARYGIEVEGNAPEDPHGEFDKQNILYEARSIEDVARLTDRSTDDVAKVTVSALERLYKVRGARQRPNLDDKVLSGWNGLMIAAFARGARVFEFAGGATSPLLTTAQSAARFVRDALWDKDRQRLLRRYRRGQAAIDGGYSNCSRQILIPTGWIGQRHFKRNKTNYFGMPKPEGGSPRRVRICLCCSD